MGSRKRAAAPFHSATAPFLINRNMLISTDQYAVRSEDADASVDVLRAGRHHTARVTAVRVEVVVRTVQVQPSGHHGPIAAIMIRIEIVPLAVYIEPARLKGAEGTVVVRIQVEPATAILLPAGQEASVAAVMCLIQKEPVPRRILDPACHHRAALRIAVVPVAAVVNPAGHHATVTKVVPVVVDHLPAVAAYASTGRRGGGAAGAAAACEYIVPGRIVGEVLVGVDTGDAAGDVNPFTRREVRVRALRIRRPDRDAADIGGLLILVTAGVLLVVAADLDRGAGDAAALRPVLAVLIDVAHHELDLRSAVFVNAYRGVPPAGLGLRFAALHTVKICFEGRCRETDIRIGLELDGQFTVVPAARRFLRDFRDAVSGHLDAVRVREVVAPVCGEGQCIAHRVLT